jgi:hypothetical protein
LEQAVLGARFHQDYLALVAQILFFHLLHQLVAVEGLDTTQV